MPDSTQLYQRLPDHIQPGVRILFVGINPGLRSAQVGHHFAGYSNRFWKLLYESGLIPEPLTCREDWRLPEWNLGLTNIIRRASAGTNGLEPAEYRRGMVQLEHTIRGYQPKIVAILGITVLDILFPTGSRWQIGRTRLHIANTPIFLLPNPSGRNAHYSYERMLTCFRELRLMASEPIPLTLFLPACAVVLSTQGRTSGSIPDSVIGSSSV